MKKSKYFHHVKISKNAHAVFNSLIMIVEYINNIQLNDLLESKLDKIESDLQNKL